MIAPVGLVGDNRYLGVGLRGGSCNSPEISLVSSMSNKLQHRRLQVL